MKKVLKLILALLVTIQFTVPCKAANDDSNHETLTTVRKIACDSEEFIAMKSEGHIPNEVLKYIEKAMLRNPDAEVSLIVDNSGNTRDNPTYTNYRTYGNHELADWVVHVQTAHNMQNVISGSSSGGFASTMLFSAAVNSISYVIPFYSYAVTAAQFILGNSSYTAGTGDKLNAAPSYSTYCKFTFVKWNGNWSLGVQSYNATLRTIAWYLYLQSTGTQYTGVGNYYLTRLSNYYSNPDYMAVQYYQTGGLIEQRPVLSIGTASFYLY